MGHITVDKLDEAWMNLDRAEYFVEEDHTHSAVLYCEKAVDDLYTSAGGLGFDLWISKKTVEISDTIGVLKADPEPNPEDVNPLISKCYELVVTCAEKVLPELYSRIDYTPTPKRFDVDV